MEKESIKEKDMEIEWIVKLQKLDNDKFVRGRGLHKTTLFRLFS